MYSCSRPGCPNTFNRIPSQVKKVKNLYCSRSCAVSVNNKFFPKNPAHIKTCKFCGHNFRSGTGAKYYCSRICKNQSQIKSKEEIIKSIQKFYSENKRIPFKQEFVHAKSARLRFGTWNKAVETAGFATNPVRFANKYISNDGHKCDSLAEKVIDDWLTFKNINHSKSPRYPNSKFTSDFKIGETYIEFFGLANGLNKYDKLKEEKLKMVSKNNYKLISIYPKDIFPQSNLDLILGKFV